MELEGDVNSLSLVVLNDLSSLGVVGKDLKVGSGESDGLLSLIESESDVIGSLDDVSKLLPLAGDNGLDALDKGALDKDELLGDGVSDGDVVTLGGLGGLVLTKGDVVLEGDGVGVLELGVGRGALADLEAGGGGDDGGGEKDKGGDRLHGDVCVCVCE